MTKYNMTKYALPGMILLLASCSQEAPDNGSNHRNPDGRIEFRAALPEVSSRATEITAAGLDDFQVRALTVGESSVTPYFIDKTFSRDRNTWTYLSYEAECIWPNNDDMIRFLAFYPGSDVMVGNDYAPTQDFDCLEGIRVAQDIASQFDFVAAVGSGCLLDNEETAVNLAFQHQLSRIRLNAWSASRSYDLEIAGVRLGGIATVGDFVFNDNADAEVGEWKNITNGYVEYVFRAGDRIVSLDGTDGSPVTADRAVSILGAKVGEGAAARDNSAMVIPSANDRWEYIDNPSNGDRHAEGMYISVLLRVIDDTPYATHGDIVYPYADEADDKVYLAVDSEDGLTVNARLYPVGEEYYTDAAHTLKYDLSAVEEVKVYGWSALPVEAVLLPGRVYTYTLNYTNGVGLRAPYDTDPGTPIISDRVIINVGVSEWIENDEDKTGVTVPRK